MSEPDPTLKRTTVRIFYKACDDYTQDVTYSSARAASPEIALLEALEELARLTALFGFEDQAQAVFDNARWRVFDWRKSRTTGAPNA